MLPRSCEACEQCSMCGCSVWAQHGCGDIAQNCFAADKSQPPGATQLSGTAGQSTSHYSSVDLAAGVLACRQACMRSPAHCVIMFTAVLLAAACSFIGSLTRLQKTATPARPSLPFSSLHTQYALHWLSPSWDCSSPSHFLLCACTRSHHARWDESRPSPRVARPTHDKLTNCATASGAVGSL